MRIPFKAASALLAIALLVLALPSLPGGEGFRNAIPGALDKILVFRGPKPVIEPVRVNENSPIARGFERKGAGKQLYFVKNLDSFYRALWRAEAKVSGSRVKILHYGDSPTTADLVTADIRDLLQKRFGDAGHGFVLIDQPWAWYAHRGVGISAQGWTINAATADVARDLHHGLGGVSFTGGAGATARLRLPDASYTRVEVLFARSPNGGAMQVTANEQSLQTIETSGATLESGFVSLDLPAGTRTLTLRVTSGPVRVYGVRLEKSGLGVEYSSMGLNGASINAIVRTFPEAHWAEQLKHQRPDLIVLNYGANESVFPAYVDRQLEGELTQVIQRIQRAVPEASILIMAPMDRGVRGGGGSIETPAVMQRIVAVQKRVAEHTGCGFFDTFTAMGGDGTMARWYASSPRLVSADFLHPTPGGAAKVGALLYEGLMEGFREYRVKNATKITEILGARD